MNIEFDIKVTKLTLKLDFMHQYFKIMPSKRKHNEKTQNKGPNNWIIHFKHGKCASYDHRLIGGFLYIIV